MKSSEFDTAVICASDRLPLHTRSGAPMFRIANPGVRPLTPKQLW